MTARTLAPFESDILDDLLEAQRRRHAAPIGIATRPRPRRRAAAAITVAAALGTATAIAVVNDSTTTTPGHADATGEHAAAPARAQTVAFITRRAAAALATVDDMVLHTRETRRSTTPSGVVTEVYDTWSDRGDPEHSRSRYTQDGRPVYDVQTDSAASSELLVDYAKRTWYRSPTIDFSHRHLIGSTPEQIREQLDAGGLTLVGYATLDGHDTLHLSRHETGSLTGDLWVDATNYLVVRSADAIGTTDYEWLDRNARSRSQLVPRVPPGFAFGGIAPATPVDPDGSQG